MVEEFDVETNKLLLRKTRKPTVLGGEGSWEIEIGEENKKSILNEIIITPNSSKNVKKKNN
jgi:hypothetical protein